MNRQVIGVMQAIFDRLTKYVVPEDQFRIVSVERHITPRGDASPVIEFVKRAACKSWECSYDRLCLFEYDGRRFVLIHEKYLETLCEIGFEVVTDEVIYQGAGMLVIGNGYLSFRNDVSSLQIIDSCLGVEAEPGHTSIAFSYEQISGFFEPYCVVELDDSRFQMSFEEDVDRLICYLIVNHTSAWSTNRKIKDILLLPSSRSIAASLLNGVLSSHIEYSYLEFYQCIEYLFKLNNCFIIATNHDISFEKAIDIVVKHELKITESDNLYNVLKDNASDLSIDEAFAIIAQPHEDTHDKCKRVSAYIYRQRCNIAHLRYDQDDTSSVNWTLITNCLIDIIYSIYQRLDENITQVCLCKNAWKPLEI